MQDLESIESVVKSFLHIHKILLRKKSSADELSLVDHLVGLLPVVVVDDRGRFVGIDQAVLGLDVCRREERVGRGDAVAVNREFPDDLRHQRRLVACVRAFVAVVVVIAEAVVVRHPAIRYGSQAVLAVFDRLLGSLGELQPVLFVLNDSVEEWFQILGQVSESLVGKFF